MDPQSERLRVISYACVYSEEFYVPSGIGWYCQISQPAHADEV